MQYYQQNAEELGNSFIRIMEKGPRSLQEIHTELMALGIEVDIAKLRQFEKIADYLKKISEKSAPFGSPNF